MRYLKVSALKLEVYVKVKQVIQILPLALPYQNCATQPFWTGFFGFVPSVPLPWVIHCSSV